MTHRYKYTYTFKPAPHALLCIFFSILINLLGNSITSALHAPIWINSIGTILCSCLLGPVAGSITGVLSIVLFHLYTPSLWIYSISSIPIAFGISIFYQRTKLRDAFQLVCSGLMIMMISAVITIPLNMLLRNGYVGNIWGDALIDMLLQNGNQKLYCSILGQLFIELPDKILVVFLSHMILKLFFILSAKMKRRCVKHEKKN